MQQYSLFTLLSVAAITGGLGFSIAKGIPDKTLVTHSPNADRQSSVVDKASSYVTPTNSDQIQIVNAPKKSAVLSEQEWLDKALALDFSAPDPNTIKELVLALQAEPLLRYQLMQRFGTESDSRIQQLIIEALGSSPTDDVVDFSIQLIGSNDIKKQKDGLVLIAAMPPTSTTHQVVKKIVEQEKNPEVLKEAITAMVPSMEITPTESQATISQLGQLTQHDNASVRARSLEMLALWDKTGKRAEDFASQAFNDAAPEVRQAAINVTMMGQLHSDRLKTNLMNVLSDTNEKSDMKMGALKALENFALNTDEYATYNRVHQEIAGLHFDVVAEKAKN